MPDLNERHAELLRNGPVRARDAALRLGTTEAALVACGATGTATALKPDWGALFAALPRLGRIMALTRNENAVHERHGAFQDVTSGPGHILVLGPDIDLRLFPGRWAHAYAMGGERPSLQVFDRDGTAVHKVFATAETDRAAWDEVVAEFATPLAALPPMTPPEPVAKAAETPVDATALRGEWQALRDTHDFITLLRRHKASRRQAFVNAGEDLALKLPATAGIATLQRAAEYGLPIMIFVGNRSAIQIHTGPVSRLRATPGWFNVLDPTFNLHLREDGVAEAWRVVKPTEDGDVTSIELMDAGGEVIAMIFGARKPGKPELPEWRDLVASVAASPWPAERAA
jgi:putative hemin transport protein